jgi:hypothetical protein
MRNFDGRAGASIARSRGEMSFRSNPPRKLAVAAAIEGTEYRGRRVSFSAFESRQSRQED